MLDKEALDHLTTLLNRQGSGLYDASDKLLGIMGGELSHEKKQQASKVHEAATSLRALIPPGRTPAWLDELIKCITGYAQSKRPTPDFMRDLVTLLPQIKCHQWMLDQTRPEGIDFEAIFEHYKASNRLPELFDRIIELLNSISASDAIDSKAMSDALSNIIATLQRSKMGTYFCLNSAWEFLCAFLQNYAWIEVSKLPVVGPLFQALEKTIKETATAMPTLHADVHGEMTRRAEQDVKFVKDTKRLFSTYGDKANLLISSEGGNGLIAQA